MNLCIMWTICCYVYVTTLKVLVWVGSVMVKTTESPNVGRWSTVKGPNVGRW